MDDTIARIRKLFRSADQIPWGAECGALIAEAITIADAAGEQQWGYAARMRQCSNAHILSDSELLLATFSVCESLHTSDPLRFPAFPGTMGAAGIGYDFADIYWMWRWIPLALMASPTFSAASVESAINDLDRIYRDHDQGPKGVAQVRLSWAMMRGDLDEVQRWTDQVHELPDDENSGCISCTRAQLVEAELMLGNKQRAMHLAGQVLDTTNNCVHEPWASVYATLLDAFAESGQTHRISSAIDEIVAEQKIFAEAGPRVALLGRFLVRSGANGRALSVLRRMLHRIAEAPFQAYAHELLLTSLALTAKANVASGHGDAPFPEADDSRLAHYFGTPEQGHTIGTVAAAAESAARKLATAFDQRNGTSAHTQLVDSWLRDDVRYDLEFDLPFDPEAAFAEAVIGSESLFRIDDTPVSEAEDATEALEAVFNLTHHYRPEEAIRLGRRWLCLIEDPIDRAQLLHTLAIATAHADPEVDPSPLAHEAMECLTAAGHRDVAEALSQLGDLIYLPVDRDGSEESIAGPYPAAVMALEESGVEAGLVGLAIALRPHGFDDPNRRDHALKLLDDAEAVIDRLGQPLLWADCLLRARLFVSVHHDDSDLGLVSGIVATMPEPRVGRVRAAWLNVRAMLLAGQGEATGALAMGLECHQVVNRWGDARDRARSAFWLGKWAAEAKADSELVAAAGYIERLSSFLPPAEAATMLWQIADLEWSAGLGQQALDHTQVALSLVKVPEEPDHSLIGLIEIQLGEIWFGANRPKDASEHYRSATEHFEQAGDMERATLCAIMIARCELQLRNVVLVGQLAEAVLKSLDLVSEEIRTRLEASARRLLAEAAARMSTDQVPEEVIWQAFEDALNAASRLEDPQEAARERVEILDEAIRWLGIHERDSEALPLARESADFWASNGEAGERGASLVALLGVLCRTIAENPVHVEEAKALADTIESDPDLDGVHDDVAHYRKHYLTKS